MSDDKAKPAPPPATPGAEADMQRNFLHHAPPANIGPRLVLIIDHHKPNPDTHPLHRDDSPTNLWRDYVDFHEISHGRSEGTKFLPKVILPADVALDQKFTKLTAEFVAKYKRMDQANAMLSTPASEVEMARAECRVKFSEAVTTVDKRQRGVGPWGTPTDAGEVYMQMMSPSFAEKPLESATAVAILRGDAFPLRSKHNIEM